MESGVFVKARAIATTLPITLIAAAALSWSGLAAPASASGSSELVGTFVLTAGSCAHGTAAGSYLQMILPSGNASGPFMSNSDSSCSDQRYTTLSGGTDGGLITGEYQPTPNPPFNSQGNALAKRITAPANYEGTAFATATDPVDPQTHTKVSAPTISDDNGRLTGDLRSFGVTWNKQYFNQGSPKPNGSEPGSSQPVSGTYDASTGAFTLTWISQVVGGPFDKFSCAWHLTGRFEPAASSSSGSSAGHSSSHHGTTTTTTKGGTTTSTGQTATTSGGNTAGRNAGSVGAVKPPGKGSQATVPADGGSIAPQVASTQAASTTIISRDKWHASWWLLALAIGIAVLGFGGLMAINRVQRRPAKASS
jgi:hypothetical protein